MEPLPIRPTTLPQARKYTREFKAEGTRIFSEDQNVIIEIPPIQNSYLTKDARIYFSMDMSFYIDNYPNVFNPGLKGPLSSTVTPLPMMDVCGPYGVFDAFEVYDYLGNTLLEKMDRHDLLAAIESDFYLDSEVDRLRPVISECQTFIADLAYDGMPDQYDPQGAVAPYGVSIMAGLGGWGYPAVNTRVNGINLMDSQLAALSRKDLWNASTYMDYSNYIYYTHGNKEVNSIPKWDFSIGLLNFLGRGSQKFVPLHNGFRIVLHTNLVNRLIKFSLPQGGMTLGFIRTRDESGEPLQYDVAELTSTITKYDLSDIRLRADILEITPELDNQVDKVVHARMKNYVMLGKCDTPTIIPGNYLSATNLKISMRHLPGTDTFSEIGFRSSTNVDACKLLYNDAVVVEYKTPLQIMNALGSDFDPMISPVSFITPSPGLDENDGGTGGYMYPYWSPHWKQAVASLRRMGSEPAQPAGYYQYYPFYFVNTICNAFDVNVNPAFFRCNTNSGKFLINFDLTLNGYSDSQIIGIDTTKTKMKIDLHRPILPATDPKDPYVTDVFIEYDAIVTITPGKYTSVSF